MTLTQMVIQGRWVTDSTLLYLPGLSVSHVTLLHARGVQCLPELLEMPNARLGQTLKLRERKQKELEAVLDRLPVVSTTVTVPHATVEAGGLGVVSVKLSRASLGRSSRADALKVYAPEWPKKKVSCAHTSLVFWSFSVSFIFSHPVYACSLALWA